MILPLSYFHHAGFHTDQLLSRHANSSRTTYGLLMEYKLLQEEIGQRN